MNLPLIEAPGAIPTPNPGNISIANLSAATMSIGGTFGTRRLSPIPVGAAESYCKPSAGGLACRITFSVPTGKQILKLYTYASTDGTGAPLAVWSSVKPVTIRRGPNPQLGNYGWYAVAHSFGTILSQSSVTQGSPATVNVQYYGVDASGTLIPSQGLIDAAGRPVRARFVLSGPYVQKMSIYASYFPFVPASFPYDGRLAGTERILVTSKTGAGVYAKTALHMLPGPTTPAQLYVWNGNTGFNGGVGDTLLEFATGASGSVAPIRTYALTGPVLKVNADGSSWNGPISETYLPSASGSSSPSFVEFAANGAEITSIPASSPVAAFDSAQNLFLSQSSGGNGQCSGEIVELSAVSKWETIARQINPPPNACGTRSIAVDANDDVFVGTRDAKILEYGPNESGDAPPVRTLSVGDSVVELTTDPQGNVYALGSVGVYRFDASASQPVTLLTGISARAFAVDTHDNLYLAVLEGGDWNSGEFVDIEEFAPGATSPSLTLARTAQLTNPYAIAIAPPSSSQ